MRRLAFTAILVQASSVQVADAAAVSGVPTLRTRVDRYRTPWYFANSCCT